MKFFVWTTYSLFFFFFLLMCDGYGDEDENDVQSYSFFICCSSSSSLELNRSLSLSCPSSSQRIQLNRLQLFYNPNDPLCHFPSRSSCSRRLTKYFSSTCNDRRQCSLKESCSSLSQSCTQFRSVQGHYLHLDYSCRSISSNEEDEDETVIVKLLTLIEDDEKEGESNRRRKMNSSSLDLDDYSFKSSPFCLFLLIFFFCVLMFFLYWLADQFGQRFCRQPSSVRPRPRPRQTLKYVYVHYDPLRESSSTNTTRKVNPEESFA